MFKERKNAKVEEGREKAIAGGGVTRQVVARSRTSERGDVDGRRSTKGTTFAGSGYARKALAASTRNGAKGNSFSVEEEGRSAMEQRMKQRPCETVKAPKWSGIFSNVK